MPDKQVKKQVRLQRRKYSVRKSVTGTNERPRLSVFRSDKHIYAQLVNDISGQTLAAAASTEKDVRGDSPNGGNVKVAVLVGKIIADRGKAAGVTKVAFDRGGRMYHGRIKALAEAAREGGLQF